MAIIRGPRPESNFYLLDKAISEDRRLGWAARGLLVYLLGKPDHWQVSVQALINETTGASTSSGRDTVYKLLGDLEATGYITRRQAKASAGKFAPIDYVVSEVPVRAGQPLPALPHTEKPEAAKPPVTDNPEAGGAPLPEKPDTVSDHPLPENPEAAMNPPLPALPYTAPPLPAKPTLVSIEVKQGLNGSNPPYPQGGLDGTEPKKSKRKPTITLQTFIADCKAKGEKAMSEYRPVIEYAETTGIGMDLLGLCWDEFKRRHLPGGSSDSKRYRDWRKAFLNCVQGNWFKLWYIDKSTKEFVLTTVGEQALRATQEAP
jgi:hypothetical protein